MADSRTKKWCRAAAVRAARTAAQTAVGMLPVAASVSEVDWLAVAGASLLAGVASLLTSVATGLPETETDRTGGKGNGSN